MRNHSIVAFLNRCSSFDRLIVSWATQMRLSDEVIAARLARPVEVVRRRRERLMLELRGLREPSWPAA
jgi:hypothetical protein